MLADTAKAAAALGLTFQVLEVRALQELDGLFAGLSKERSSTDAVAIDGSPYKPPYWNLVGSV